jgi:transposase
MAGGRPSAWETRIKPYLEEIVALKKQGKTDKQIAEYLGIGYTTLTDNKVRYAELAEALKKGKNELVLKLESALYKRALGGYYTKKITRTYIEDEDGKKTGSVQVTEQFSEEKPDVGALVFALKNLDPERWRDKVETNVNVEELSQAMHDFLDSKV